MNNKNLVSDCPGGVHGNPIWPMDYTVTIAGSCFLGEQVKLKALTRSLSLKRAFHR